MDPHNDFDKHDRPPDDIAPRNCGDTGVSCVPGRDSRCIFCHRPVQEECVLPDKSPLRIRAEKAEAQRDELLVELQALRDRPEPIPRPPFDRPEPMRRDLSRLLDNLYGLHVRPGHIDAVLEVVNLHAPVKVKVDGSDDVVAALKAARGHMTAPFVDTDGAVRQYVKAIIAIQDAIDKAEGK